MILSGRRLAAQGVGKPASLRSTRTTYDTTGRTALVSEAVYNPLRTEFVVELSKTNTESTGRRLLNA